MKPLLQIGLKRSIEDDDIYAVGNSMRSDQNTDIFDKLWEQELKKANPSILRVIFKTHLYKVFIFGSLFSIVDIISK